MKKLFPIFFLFFTLTSFAQNKATLSPKAKALCATWHLSKTELFSNPLPPTEAQKNDLLMLMESARYRLIYNGAPEAGTWLLDKAESTLIITSDTGLIKKIKLLDVGAQTIKLDYKDEDEVHNILYYINNAATQK
jgi:hypothetical protein